MNDFLLGADDTDIAVQSGVDMSLWELTAGAMSCGVQHRITAPNLAVMKTQLEKKKEIDHDHGITNVGCW